MKVNHNGKQVEAKEVTCIIKDPKMEWIEFLLEDGTILKVKPVIISVLKLDLIDQQTGMNEYMIKAQNVITVRKD